MMASLSAWMRDWRKGPVIGVDLADEQVHLLELLAGNRVRACISASLPRSDTFQPALVAASIRAALRHGGLRARQAALAMPASLLQIRRLRLPPGLDEDSLQELLRADAERYLPYPASECCFDFEQLPPASAEHCELRLYACARRELEPRCEALRLAGLRVLAVDLESHALEAGLRACLPAPGNGLLLHMRRRRSELLLLVSGETQLLQELPGHEQWREQPAAYTQLLKALRTACSNTTVAHQPLLLSGAGPDLRFLAMRLQQDLQLPCTPVSLPGRGDQAALLAYGLACRARMPRA